MPCGPHRLVLADEATRGDGHGRHGLQPDPKLYVTSHDGRTPTHLGLAASYLLRRRRGAGQLSEWAEAEIVFETFFAPAGHTV